MAQSDATGETATALPGSWLALVSTALCTRIPELAALVGKWLVWRQAAIKRPN